MSMCYYNDTMVNNGSVYKAFQYDHFFEPIFGALCKIRKVPV